MTQATVRVVHPRELVPPSQAHEGLLSQAGIDEKTAGATRLWLGREITLPHKSTAIHDHGANDTAAYVLRGNLRIEFGDTAKQSVMARAGDFFFIPAGLPHLEFNDGDEEVEAIVLRSSQPGHDDARNFNSAPGPTK